MQVDGLVWDFDVFLIFSLSYGNGKSYEEKVMRPGK
jgi:hypothetical protein